MLLFTSNSTDVQVPLASVLLAVGEHCSVIDGLHAPARQSIVTASWTMFASYLDTVLAVCW
jgi:hypothetical protein